MLCTSSRLMTTTQDLLRLNSSTSLLFTVLLKQRQQLLCVFITFSQSSFASDVAVPLRLLQTHRVMSRKCLSPYVKQANKRAVRAVISHLTSGVSSAPLSETKPRLHRKPASQSNHHHHHSWRGISFACHSKV